MVEKKRHSLFAVLVNIENKPFLDDPEGQTILHDLILKGGYKDVKGVKTSKSIRFDILAIDKNDAKEKVKKICESLRIYNPIVSNCNITIKNKDEDSLKVSN
jgi:phosphoribosylformylglycinamidine synthase PurS subunit